MFPGLGKIDPRKMQGMMKQLGMSQEELPAEKVEIHVQDKKIVINNPSVQKIKFQGQTSYQISGEETEEPYALFTEQDVSLVIEKTSCSKEKAIQTLKSTQGDIAEAITKLSE